MIEELPLMLLWENFFFKKKNNEFAKRCISINLGGAQIESADRKHSQWKENSHISQKKKSYKASLGVVFAKLQRKTLFLLVTCLVTTSTAKLLGMT